MDASWSVWGGLGGVLEASWVPWRRLEVVLERLRVVLRWSWGVLRWSWGGVSVFEADFSCLGGGKKLSWGSTAECFWVQVTSKKRCDMYCAV